MMEWNDIACIVFVCVTANHLGLISAIESVINHKIWIVRCPKCFTFWSVLAYQATVTDASATEMLAVSFLASYSAIWLELIEGFIDTLYLRLYDKIYKTNDNTVAADTNNGDTSGTVPELQ
jgi:hypothetical protein